MTVAYSGYQGCRPDGGRLRGTLGGKLWLLAVNVLMPSTPHSPHPDIHHFYSSAFRVVFLGFPPHSTPAASAIGAYYTPQVRTRLKLSGKLFSIIVGFCPPCPHFSTLSPCFPIGRL
jgi:hypothetical protein